MNETRRQYLDKVPPSSQLEKDTAQMESESVSEFRAREKQNGQAQRHLFASSI